MFVEEGFRVRFANGEVIDFYADTHADKEGWLKVLDGCVGKNAGAGKSGGWCEMVLKREESRIPKEVRKTSGEKRGHGRTKSMYV